MTGLWKRIRRIFIGRRNRTYERVEDAAETVDEATGPRRHPIPTRPAEVVEELDDPGNPGNAS